MMMKQKLLIIVCLSMLIMSCKKKGCTNPVATNYSTEAKKDDGTCTFTEIGDYAFGGVVFWINPLDSTHGLVCDINDLASPTSWGCGANTFATEQGIGSGMQNTIDIGLVCPTSPAKTCENLELNGYSDWFLPSSGELTEMFFNKTTINATALVNGGQNFSPEVYWGSTEFIDDPDAMFIYHFGSSYGTYALKNWAGNDFYVRAVRAY